MKRTWFVLSVLLVLAMLLAACQPAATPAPTTAPTQPPAEPTKPAAEPTQAPEVTEPVQPQEFVFGMLLVGPYNDRGWSQAHYEAGLYVEEKVPGAKMIYIDKVNPADRPGTTPEQLAEDLVSKGAKLVIFNSDDMKDGAEAFAKARPDIIVIHASGDGAWKEGKNYRDLPNLGNVMGRMEYGKMIAGCAAALTTKTGQIGYLGPLINDETRRLAAAAYLGARYCWTEYLGKDPAQLKFKVTWIGFWFNIPGVTADPTQVADDFFNSNYDVVISGIDTTEALVEAKKFRGQGKEVWAVPYDYIEACKEAEEVCLGVPYFNWGPMYAKYIQEAIAGTWKPSWDWVGPDWNDINNPDTSHVGFVKGAALSADASAQVDKFISELAAGLNLWKGPLNFQDGTPFLKEGEVATDLQVWYLPQLLEGMEGQSVSE
ncbi:lipoprotein [Thermanaerothrix daxensis]|uniref:Lipoprotein n=1 Tax=Thermanaerothrix daxensis TaxID=869279 RepID=A0A0P6XXV2_9CHLR|nr:BMP family ABC transporter substrate-binding protein [Thermanaerothrix daxensis]KPL84392.1 lipoprotein [Thermanaerothrix daxensis]